MNRHDILQSKGYWEEADRTPENIAKQVKEAVTSALKEAAEKAKTKKTGNSGSWHDASVDKESILSLIPKDK